MSRKVELGDRPVELAVDLELEPHLALGEGHPTLQCAGDQCVSLLRKLRERTRVAEVVGIPLHHSAPSPIRVGTNGAPSLHASAVRPVDSTWATFHPLYLVPLGVGQFYQERWAFGASYLATCLGVLGWHIAARVQFDQVNTGQQRDAANAWKLQADLSFWLLVGAVAATSIEAVVVGLIWGSDDPTP